MKKQLRKGKYKITNWSEYNNSLKNRGDITFWISSDALENWLEKDSALKQKGRQIKYSKLALQTMNSVAQIRSLIPPKLLFMQQSSLTYLMRERKY